MFLSFRQQKPKEQEAAQNRLAIRIVHQCLKIQVRWANFLQYKTEGLSSIIKKFGLAFFCLLSGGYSSFLLMRSFSKQPSKAIEFYLIKFSAPVSQTRDQKLQHTVVISPEDFEKLQRLRHMQDSLAQSSSDKKIQGTFSGSVPD